MRPIRRATLAHDTARGVELDAGHGFAVRISFLDDRLARVVVVRPGGLRERRTWSVLAPGTEDVPWDGRDRMDESSWPVPGLRREGGVIHGPGLSVSVSFDPFRLEWLLPDGRVFLADRAGMPYIFSHRGSGLAHYAMRHPEDRYYGLGDKTGPLDLHGRRLRTRMTDALGYDPRAGDPLYKHWPFLLARDGATGASYGVYYDNMGEAAFDLGCEHDNYHGLFRGYEAADGDLDYYVMLGPALHEVTPRFLHLTGRTALPPRWTLGYAQTAMAIADVPDAQAQMERFIDRCAAEDVPISSFHMGSGYTSIGVKRYVFNWNTSKFPQPERLMERFHAAGMHVVANLKPCLLDDHPRYAEAAASGAFVTDGTGKPLLSQFWDGEGAHLDFTSAAGIAWWQEGMRRAVLDTGIDVGWNDNNEYELWDEDATCAGFGTPLALALARPVQPLLMTRATRDVQAERAGGERVFTVTRAGCPGVQRYAQGWSGDNTTSWDTLRWNLRTGLQMSLSGLLNTGHDVGGFAGPVPDAELLTRWTQSGLLHPRFIMNSWKPDAVFNCPWLHPDALPAVREAIRLRYRLIPYLYSLMHEAHATGAAVLRPTFLEFDDDPGTAADCDELMVGPFLLAAPVVEPGARSRTAYLPAGPEEWIGFDDGVVHPAGVRATVEAPLEHLPLFARAGAIVPATDPGAGFARLHDEPSRVLLVFPGRGTGGSRFVLTEDDGRTAGGPVTRVTCLLHWTPESVELSVAVEGGYALPYDSMGVRLPRGDGRKLRLQGDARIALRA